MLSRRDLLRAASLAAGLPGRGGAASPVIKTIVALDCRGVTLRASCWRRQVLAAREFYLELSDDDILHGFRRAAGLAAPGKPLGGWCKDDSSMVLGQWLSGQPQHHVLRFASGVVHTLGKPVSRLPIHGSGIGILPARTMQAEIE